MAEVPVLTAGTWLAAAAVSEQLEEEELVSEPEPENSSSLCSLLLSSLSLGGVPTCWSAMWDRCGARVEAPIFP